MSKTTLFDNQVPDAEIVREIDPKVYNDVARCAHLLSIQMIESSFNISPKYFDPDHEGKAGLDFSDLHSSFDYENRVATAVFSFDSHVKKGKKRVFSCKGKFIVFYRIPSDCDDVHAEAFARKTGLTACYPYFRSYVATTSAMANADMPILPIITAMPVKEKIKEAR